jgi:hypothetical protein
MKKFPVIYVDFGHLAAIDVAKLNDSQTNEQFSKLTVKLSNEIERFKRENSETVPRYAIIRENFLFSMSCKKKDMLARMLQESIIDKILIISTNVDSGGVVGIIRHVFSDYSTSEIPDNFKKRERGDSYVLLQLK